MSFTSVVRAHNISLTASHTSASSHSGDEGGDGEFVPTRPQRKSLPRARTRWAFPTWIIKKKFDNGGSKQPSQ